MSSSYPAFDITKPDPSGTSQTGPQALTSINTNDASLIYSLVAGTAPGWVYAPVVGSGTAEQPQYLLWTNSAYRVRATVTWGSSLGATGNLSSVVWEVSQDSGTTPNSTGTWATMGSTQTFTYDSNGNLTATTNSGSFMSLVAYLIGKVKALLSNFNTHTAATGTAVHGLGSMSTQSYTAVGITGGSIDGATVGVSNPAAIIGKTFKANTVSYGTITTNTTIDWSLGDYYYMTIAGNLTLSWSNLPSVGVVQGITMELTNPGAFTLTWPTGVKWPSGTAPARTVSGVDIYAFTCRDGSTVRGVQAEKDTR